MPPSPQTQRKWSLFTNIICAIIFLALHFNVSTGFSSLAWQVAYLFFVLWYMCTEMWKDYKERMAEHDTERVEWRVVGMQRMNGRDYLMAERQ